MLTSLNRNNTLSISFILLITGIAGCFIAYKIVHIPMQFEMVVLFSIAVFYPVLRQPATGIYLIFIIMPLIPHVRRLYYLLHQRPQTDPLIITGDILTSLTLIGLFFAFKEQQTYQQNGRLVKNCILIYFIYLFTRVFFLNSLPLGEALLKFRFYGPAVLLFFIGSYYARHGALLKRLWIITSIIGVVAALYGFKQLFIGYSVSEKLWFSNISFTTLFIKGLARPFSLFQSPAAFADYMQLSLIGILILFGSSTSAKRFFLLPVILLFFYGALITSVRSNWIGIIISLLTWFTILTLRKNSHRIIGMGALILLFFVFQIINDAKGGIELQSAFQVLGGGFNQQNMNMLITERSSALANPFEEYSFLSRMNLWRYIIELSVDPVLALLGRGVGVLNADSLYFTYLAEFGYPGLFFIVWLIFYTITKGLHYTDTCKDRTLSTIIKGITLMNIVFAVINITGTHIHSFPGDVFFWFWNGVLIELASPAARKSNTDTALLPDNNQLRHRSVCSNTE